MKENQILVIIKEPGKPPVVEPFFDNTLEEFQKTVGGHIETVTITSNLVLVCNEEGRLLGLPHNLRVCGLDFCGTVIAVSASGEEFCSLKAAAIPFVMDLLKGDADGS
jgi:hypothetical protein